MVRFNLTVVRDIGWYKSSCQGMWKGGKVERRKSGKEEKWKGGKVERGKVYVCGYDVIVERRKVYVWL
jgi:hypothetical protein